MNKFAILLTSLTLATVSISSHAAEPFEAEIEARKAHMQVVKFNMGILGAMAKGSTEYKAEVAEVAAKNIHALSLLNNSAMWPEGSDEKSLSGKTTATVDIWKKPALIQENNQAWIKASDELAQKAGLGLSELRSSIGAVGKSCKGCHTNFRSE